MKIRRFKFKRAPIENNRRRLMVEVSECPLYGEMFHKQRLIAIDNIDITETEGGRSDSTPSVQDYVSRRCEASPQATTPHRTPSAVVVEALFVVNRGRILVVF